MRFPKIKCQVFETYNLLHFSHENTLKRRKMMVGWAEKLSGLEKEITHREEVGDSILLQSDPTSCHI